MYAGSTRVEAYSATALLERLLFFSPSAFLIVVRGEYGPIVQDISREIKVDSGRPVGYSWLLVR